jgi:hypothetical protein
MSERTKFLLILVPFLCVALLVALPNFIRARSVRAMNSCVNNIRQVQGAKEQWGVENQKTTNDIVTWEDVLPYLQRKPECPHGGTYILGRIGEDVRCSHATTGRQD